MLTSSKACHPLHQGEVDVTQPRSTIRGTIHGDRLPSALRACRRRAAPKCGAHQARSTPADRRPRALYDGHRAPRFSPFPRLRPQGAVPGSVERTTLRGLHARSSTARPCVSKCPQAGEKLKHTIEVVIDRPMRPRAASASPVGRDRVALSDSLVIIASTWRERPGAPRVSPRKRLPE